MTNRAELVRDFDVVRQALEHALTYPQKLVLGNDGYSAAHEELSSALYSLNRMERLVARIDTG